MRETKEISDQGKPQPLSAHQWLLLALVLVADVLDMMDSTICNIAAPSIVGDLGGGAELMKWLGASYALAMGALLVLGGRLGDRFGKNRMFLIGVFGFIVASVACGLAWSPTVLIVARAVQGAFGALLLPQGLSILMATFSREQFPIAMMAFGPTLGLSAVLGPIVAGWILSMNLFGLSWRPVFLINIVIGLACFLTAWRSLGPDQANRPRESLDVPGTLLLVGATLGLFFGLIQGPQSGWAAGDLVAIAVGGLLFVGFVLRQRTAESPLLRLSLFRNRGFVAGLIIGVAFFSTVNGFSYVLALFYQQTLHLSPLDSSLGMVPLLAGIILSSVFGRPMIARLGRRYVVLGLVVTLVGASILVATSLFVDVTSSGPLIPALVILGLGMGACFGSIFDVALGNVSEEESGSASGSLSAVQQFANALGAALVTTVYFFNFSQGQGERGFEMTSILMFGLVALCLPLTALLPRNATKD